MSDEPRYGGLVDKHFVYKVIIVILWAIVFYYMITYSSYKYTELLNNASVIVAQRTLGLNPNIIFNYDCRSTFNNAYYSCKIPYENLTGYYCNGTLICENNYEWVQ